MRLKATDIGKYLALRGWGRDDLVDIKVGGIFCNHVISKIYRLFFRISLNGAKGIEKLSNLFQLPNLPRKILLPRPSIIRRANSIVAKLWVLRRILR